MVIECYKASVVICLYKQTIRQCECIIMPWWWELERWDGVMFDFLYAAAIDYLYQCKVEF